MADNKLLKTWGDSCARSIAFQLIGFLVIIGIFSIPAIVVALVIGEQRSGFGIYISIIFILIFVTIVGLIIWGFNSIRKRTLHMDAVFIPLGLEGETHLQIGRHYHGEIKGRHVDGYYHRGPTLEIQIATPLQARAIILYKSEIGKISTSLENYEEVIINNPLFHNLGIYAQDKYWLENMLDNPQTRQVIRQLMRVTSAYELRQVRIQPKTIKLTIRRLQIDEINTNTVKAWFDDLFTLLRTFEAAPAPQAPTVEIPIVHQKQVNRNSITILATAATCSVLFSLTAYILLWVAIITIVQNVLTP